MRLSDAERKRAKQMAEFAVPVATVKDANGPEFDLFATLRLGDEADETVRRFGRERGRHINGLGWRMARRFGWRVVAVA